MVLGSLTIEIALQCIAGNGFETRIGLKFGRAAAIDDPYRMTLRQQCSRNRKSERTGAINNMK